MPSAKCQVLNAKCRIPQGGNSARLPTCATLHPYLAGPARCAPFKLGTLPTFLLAGSWMEELRAHLRCADSPVRGHLTF
jgi:hypothetical protein